MPLPGQRARPAARRPDADGLGHRRAEGPLPRPDPVGRGDLVPGLLRARRRLRPRGAEDRARSRTATTGSSPARRSGPAARSTRSGACSSRAPTARRAKHKGLTYFLMDMEQDAVQVRPLRQITGEAEFNELFIEEARIPDENVVGGVGNGWKVALTTLMNERAGLGFFLQVRLRQLLDDLLARRGRARPARGPARRRQARRAARAHRGDPAAGLAGADRRSSSYGQPGPEGSLAKWLWSETNQQLTQLAADIVGPEALTAGTQLELRAAARPRQLDRGRHDRDPQEHRRRARARPAAAEGRG